MKVAIFGTSVAMKPVYKDGHVVEAEASDRLVETLKDGYEVYILTTRENLYPHDQCWISLIEKDHILIPEKGGQIGLANKAVIALWDAIYTKLGLIKPDGSKYDPNNWFDWMRYARDQGIRTH